MTSGDGFPQGVEMEDNISRPSANDYRKYGKEREQEAQRALGILGLKRREVAFPGFPDSGLSQLIIKFRSDPLAYTSPFTLVNHPLLKDFVLYLRTIPVVWDWDIPFRGCKSPGEPAGFSRAGGVFWARSCANSK